VKHIKKRASPEGFENWKRLYQKKHFDDLPASLPEYPEVGIFYYSKGQLKDELLKEQNNVCCYCNNSIVNDQNTSIEHLEPREGDNITERIFDYNNLLASCNGGRKINKKPKILYCDAAKEMNLLQLTPLMKECEDEIYFDALGKIYGMTSRAKNAIDCLNLENPILKNLRVETLEPFIFEMDAYGKITKNLLGIQELRKIYNSIKTDHSHKFQIVILSVLEKLIN
jgi:uncharacterized protein (TIGR02646 family)